MMSFLYNIIVNFNDGLILFLLGFLMFSLFIISRYLKFGVLIFLICIRFQNLIPNIFKRNEPWMVCKINPRCPWKVVVLPLKFSFSFKQCKTRSMFVCKHIIKYHLDSFTEYCKQQTHLNTSE